MSFLTLCLSRKNGLQFLGEFFKFAGIVKSSKLCVNCDRLCVNSMRASCVGNCKIGGMRKV